MFPELTFIFQKLTLILQEYTIEVYNDVHICEWTNCGT